MQDPWKGVFFSTAGVFSSTAGPAPGPAEGQHTGPLPARSQATPEARKTTRGRCTQGLAHREDHDVVEGRKAAPPVRRRRAGGRQVEAVEGNTERDAPEENRKFRRTPPPDTERESIRETTILPFPRTGSASPHGGRCALGTCHRASPVCPRSQGPFRRRVQGVPSI